MAQRQAAAGYLPGALAPPSPLLTSDPASVTPAGSRRRATTRDLITRYARRMTIEQRLAEIIRAFCADALSSTVNLNVDLDIMLTLLAPLAALRARLPGLRHRHPRDHPRPLPGNPRNDHRQQRHHHRAPGMPRLHPRLTRCRPARPDPHTLAREQNLRRTYCVEIRLP